MFTGIVSAQGTVTSVEGTPVGRRLTISAPDTGVTIGGSVAVDGVCLTAVAVADDGFTVEVMKETLDRATLGSLSDGDAVNLERPVGPDGLFEGHIVQGHVDGVATVRSVTPEGESRRVVLEASSALTRYIVEKGSIALDGVSLTITEVDDDHFGVALIPHTLDVTTLGGLEPGDQVNVELDVIAKYIERLVR